MLKIKQRSFQQCYNIYKFDHKKNDFTDNLHSTKDEHSVKR